jgi:GT2 family glycosyltransferase
MHAPPPPTTSVLIPSFGRPASLVRCLRSLGEQRVIRPQQVVVVWQGDDEPTRLAAEGLREAVPYRLDVIHSDRVGVVAAENAALAAATGEVVLLIDDDAVAPDDWVARHVAHYADARVGAVGGPADNHRPDGAPFPRRTAEPVGRLTWYGRALGNLHDHAAAWRTRPPRDVDHLVGNNMSLRRAAFDRFEIGLRPYWQMFELDACLQVKARGYRVVCDFANVVAHHPTNLAYAGGRDGDLRIKVYHAAYNQAFVLAKHSPRALRVWRALYVFLVGSTGAPGLLASLVAVGRYGHPVRELRILGRTWRYALSGWRAGAAARRGSRVVASRPASVPEGRPA